MKSTKIKIMVEGAVMIALATVLSIIKVYQLPWGGSITLLSMLPIALYSIKHGIKKGLTVSFLYSLVQLCLGITIDGLFGWGLTAQMLTACIFLDYIGAFTAIGLAGIFRNKGIGGKIAGIVIALILRFACHFTSGIVVFHSFGELWKGFSTQNTYLYSLLYNASYMLPEIIFTVIGAVILLTVPQTKKLLKAE
ncbi:MAG: energy-coupled thiamine transporter ThiT [Oscillospiraceae bacterium]